MSIRTAVVSVLLCSCTLPSVVHVRDASSADALDDRSAPADVRGEDTITSSDVETDATIDGAADVRDASDDSTLDGDIEASVDSGLDVFMESAVDANDANDANDARDVSDASDAREAAVDVISGPTTPATLIAPVSGAITSGRVPRYRWSLPAGARNVRIQFHSDRSFGAPVGEEHRLADGTTTWEPTAPIPRSVTEPGHRVFWRIVHGGAGTDVPSTPWQVRFPAEHSARSRVGVSWGTSRDANGDGFDDLLVGAAFDFASSGYVSVYTSRGGPITAATIPSRVDEAPRTMGSLFGGSLTWAGDINGDGYADAIVGHESLSANLPVSYYLGGPMGLVTRAAAQLPAIGASFGYALAALGDVNGDGFGDVAVGTPQSATVAIYSGSASGTLARAATLTDSMGSRFGTSIVGACDFNGDGRSDLAVGAPGLGTHGSVRVYVNNGSATPFSTVQTITPADESGGFGSSISCVGDVDGDGDHELVVASPGAGLVYMFRGQSTGAMALTNVVPLFYTPMGGGGVSSTGGFGRGVGDLDRDGFDDIVITSTSNQYLVYLDPVSGSTTPRIVTGAGGFGVALSGVGDLDRNGSAEFAVGSTAGLVSLRQHSSMGATPERFALMGDTAAGFGRALPSH